ncbi:MAG: hypothetical protein IJA52_07575 [Clostridia bacterium]|nr:hypothetical protein [Clostridia bacterium]
MISHIIALSVLCALVILIRALFKNRVSARIVYALWLVVLIKLCIPVSVVSIDVPLPSFLEEYSAVVEAEAEEPFLNHEESDPSQSSPVIQTPPMHSQVSGSTAPEADLTVPAPPTEPIIPNEPIMESEKIPEEVNKLSIDPLKLILIIWALGSLAFLLIFSTVSVITQIKLRKSRSFYTKEGRIPIYVSDGIASPCVTGIIPTVYITSYAKECKDLELIIKHELTHVRHGDHIWAVIRIIAIVLFWWNPFIWAAAILSKRDAELACDESVVKNMSKSERLCYSRLILDMIPKKRTFAVSFADAPIKHRLFRLTGKYKTKLFAAIIATVLVAVSFCFAFVSYASDDGDPAGEDEIHVHTFEKATCTSPALCECGESDGDALGHIWHEATCTKPKTCSRCKTTEGSPISHTWTDPTCSSPKTCVVCKFYEGDHLEHVFSDATCTSPRLCTLCGEPDGEPLGHTFSAATCTTPMTCTRCGATEGYALGHKYYFEACTVCGAENAEYYERMNKANQIFVWNSQISGISRAKFDERLLEAGFTTAEIDYMVPKMEIDWEQQAQRAKSYYLQYHLQYYMGYTKEDVYDYLIDKGFGHEIAYELTNKMKNKSSPYAISDLVESHSSKNQFGGYNGEPIYWDEPVKENPLKDLNTGGGYRPGIGNRP